MSYWFNVRAASKAAAKDAVSAKFDEVVVAQPIHVRDKAAALASAASVIDLLADNDPREISVSVSGSLQWLEVLRSDSSNPLQGASVSAFASYIAA